MPAGLRQPRGVRAQRQHRSSVLLVALLALELLDRRRRAAFRLRLRQPARRPRGSRVCGTEPPGLRLAPVRAGVPRGRRPERRRADHIGPVHGGASSARRAGTRSTVGPGRSRQLFPARRQSRGPRGPAWTQSDRASGTAIAADSGAGDRLLRDPAPVRERARPGQSREAVARCRCIRAGRRSGLPARARSARRTRRCDPRAARRTDATSPRRTALRPLRGGSRQRRTRSSGALASRLVGGRVAGAAPAVREACRARGRRCSTRRRDTPARPMAVPRQPSPAPRANEAPRVERQRGAPPPQRSAPHRSAPERARRAHAPERAASRSPRAGPPAGIFLVIVEVYGGCRPVDGRRVAQSGCTWLDISFGCPPRGPHHPVPGRGDARDRHRRGLRLRRRSPADLRARRLRPEHDHPRLRRARGRRRRIRDPAARHHQVRGHFADAAATPSSPPRTTRSSSTSASASPTSSSPP